MTVGFVVEEFVAVERGALRGFARVRLPSGMVLHDVGIYSKGDANWVSPASRPKLGRDGTQMKDRDGKPQWTSVVSFANRDLRDRVSAAVIDALRLSHPGVLG